MIEVKYEKLKINEVLKLLPKKNKLKNKTDFGHTLIIAGSNGFIGAGILSSMAATKMGSGYVHLASDIKKFPWIKYPDVILHPLKTSILKGKNQFSVVIGPGLKETVAEKFIKVLIKENFSKVVVDATALNIINKYQKQIPKSWIITPHTGEAMRILNLKEQNIEHKKIAENLLKMKCHVYLKGHQNLLLSPLKEYYSCDHNHPCLAKAGSGDVLSGILGALLAIGLKPMDAMKLGSWVHGELSLAFILEGNDELSLRPVDLISHISLTLKKMRNKALKLSKV